MSGDTIKIHPWTNRQMLNYEDVKAVLEDKVENKSIDYSEYKQQVEKKLFEILVNPNINQMDESTKPIGESIADAERMMIFVECYKLSRGPIVEIFYDCGVEKCKAKSTHKFNLSDKAHYTYVPLSTTQVKFKFGEEDIVLSLQKSTYRRFKDDKVTDEAGRNTKEILSYIETMKVGDDEITTKDHSLDDLLQWVYEEAEDGLWREVATKVTKQIPTLKFQYHFSCSRCKHKEDKPTTFPGLPDFSLGLF